MLLQIVLGVFQAQKCPLPPYLPLDQIAQPPNPTSPYLYLTKNQNLEVNSVHKIIEDRLFKI